MPEKEWHNGFRWGAVVMTLLIILTLILKGCVPNPCFGDLIGNTPYGTSVCVEQEVSLHEVYQAQTIVLDLVKELHPEADMDAAYHGLDVHFVDTALAVGCDWSDGTMSRCDQNVEGITRWWEKWVTVRWRPCMHYRAFVHELLHVAQIWGMGMSPDSGNYGQTLHHSTPGFFIIQEGQDSLEYRAFQAVKDTVQSCENFP